MRRFAALFTDLDAQTSTRAKVDALVRYFSEAEPRDAAWAVYFLAGGKPRAVVNSGALREFALGASGLPGWLFEESYQAVGDLAETIALLLPPPRQRGGGSLADWVEQRLLPLRGRAPAEVLAALAGYVDELDTAERFLLFKLIGGGFRVGVSRLLVTRALAEHAGVDAKLIAQRMIGYTDDLVPPSAGRYRGLLADSDSDRREDDGQPYPFFLAHALPLSLEQFDATLGPPADWLIEWKYDGIRAQLVKRGGAVHLLSRGEELITERFPEIARRAHALPDGTVLDGEVLVWRDGAPQAFALLQKRITRKTVTPKVLAEAPAVFIAYDLLEADGLDQRARPQRERRARLLEIAARHGVDVSPAVEAGSWDAIAALRAGSRERGVEGLMLKHLGSTYRVGRTKDAERANWWKWKIDPYSVDAVLVYAQRGHGRRASLYTDYTFAVWDRVPASADEAQRVIDAIAADEAPAALQSRGLPVLVPFAKAYSGLTDDEIRQVDAQIRRTTVEKFGPVRTLVPSLVFELGFEGIQRSGRHKSGIAVRFPRMLRWRHDKPVAEADTLATLQALLRSSGQGSQ
ncbi:MAG TPA: cisplatin damage response ATP-dependent DNA ligase [Burkholderiaceae bacterium]|nr:cisplatin damage response ATP-dependent DNA ligase [Burkholderiaceae bacterium]